MKNLWLYLVYLVAFNANGAASVPTINNSPEYPEYIVALRKLQRQVSPRDYVVIENAISKLKDHAEVRDTVKPSLLMLVPAVIAQLVFLGLWWSLLFFGTMMRMRRRYGMLISLTLTLALASACVMNDYYIHSQQWGITKLPAVDLKLGPGKEYATRAVLHALDELAIIGQKESWYKVDRRGVRGWIHANDIAL